MNGERRSFALLRPVADAPAQEAVREMILAAYAEHVQAALTEQDIARHLATMNPDRLH